MINCINLLLNINNLFILLIFNFILHTLFVFMYIVVIKNIFIMIFIHIIVILNIIVCHIIFIHINIHISIHIIIHIFIFVVISIIMIYININIIIIWFFDCLLSFLILTTIFY